MASSYTASDIEVLSGLDPVRRRPGMYTDTTRPNHLAHEVVDNSVDEALAGYCENIRVTVFKDGSLEVEDDGRGMPVDVHPKEKISGVELILTRLHAGGKFNDKTYQHAGGLHGVGVSVVNALSKRLECRVRRGGKEYRISFAGGRLASKLEVVGEVPKSKTGTTLRFWPDPQYFDTDKFAAPKLRQVLRAKAVLCPKLRVTLKNEITGESDEWFYTGGLHEYLAEQLGKGSWLPAETFYGKRDIDGGSLDWALAWVRESEQSVGESYVNLIPTIEGGTHVNGLRVGASDAVREFCEFRNLVPRGLKLAPEDVWDGVSYVLSMKMREPHLVPLSTQAVEILRELHALTGDGRYVFPGARTNGRPMSDNAVLAALRRMGFAKDEMSGHGFRAMARTILDEVLGVRPDFIEHQLAHAVRDPNGRAYNRTAHLAERRKMMQQWADYLDKLKAGAEVIPLSA